MTVLSLAALLAMLAIPNFKDLIDRYRTRRASEDLTASLFYARAEGIKRGGFVTLRRTQTSTCARTDVKDWSCGWQIFTDQDSNGDLDGTDVLLRQSDAPVGVKVSLNRGAVVSPYVSIDSWGKFAGSGMTFSVEPINNDRADQKTALCMSSGGRLRTYRGATTCS